MRRLFCLLAMLALMPCLSASLTLVPFKGKATKFSSYAEDPVFNVADSKAMKTLANQIEKKLGRIVVAQPQYVGAFENGAYQKSVDYDLFAVKYSWYGTHVVPLISTTGSGSIPLDLMKNRILGETNEYILFKTSLPPRSPFDAVQQDIQKAGFIVAAGEKLRVENLEKSYPENYYL